MNEKPPKVLESTNTYELSSNEVRTMALVRDFRRDPLGTLQEIKAAILDDGPESAVVIHNVVDQIESIYDAAQEETEIANDDIDAGAQAFLASEKYSLEYNRHLLQLMRDAGYTYDEVLVWVTLESDAVSPADVLEDKGLRVVFNEIYHAN